MRHDSGRLKVEIDNVSYSISYKHRSGSSDLMVFIHGLGCTQETFSDVWDREDFIGPSLLSFDLVGFGESEKAEDFSYTMDDLARVCGEVIEQFDYARLHLVCHSMGGAVGLLLADLLPDKPTSFTNIEGNLITSDTTVSRLAVNMSYESYAERIWPEILSLVAGEDRIVSMVDTCLPLAFYRCCLSLVEWSDSGTLLEKFLRLDSRKIYLYGDKNAGLEVLGRLGDVEKRGISNAGHFPMFDNPDEFYSVLSRFIGLSGR